MEIRRLSDHVPYEGAIQSVGPGWHPLVREIYDLVEADPHPPRVLQVKEKFGGLRVYTSAVFGTPLDEKISEICHRSYRVCEECGKEATLCKKSFGWLLTLCEEHRVAVGASVAPPFLEDRE